LGRLTQAGVEIVIDDVGTGYSGLSHLLKTKPHLMKLDIELVQGIDGDLARQSLAKGLSHFARTTGCRLVAKGVETAAELHTLRDLGVDLIQGYLLGRPSDVKTALAWF
jgi:EAL domain-containing protein (putative c-di-GMP-specific phosphodiesterase class I)